MKVTRALLLSSKKQAESFECASGYLLFRNLAPRRYRYLVTDCRGTGDGLVFEICRVTQETSQEEGHCAPKTRDIVADEAHVHEEFTDAGELINFLRRFQIDFEVAWEPVEESE